MLSELSERDATGAIAAIYAEIRRLWAVPYVSSLPDGGEGIYHLAYGRLLSRFSRWRRSASFVTSARACSYHALDSV